MLVVNSFDLWQKDTFFSAAEEVQQSADIMESAYRTWIRARTEGLDPQNLDELERELQLALGTAKWQLEEFEKAVCLSYKNRNNDITMTRHRQFVSVIEDQILRVEIELKETYNAEGKKPFRWVNLDADECDDLALFLSGSSQGIQDEDVKHIGAVTSSVDKISKLHDHSRLESEIISKAQVSNQGKRVEEVFADNEISYQQMGSSRRNCSSPVKNSLEIVIDINDSLENNVLTDEATPKEKGSKPFAAKGGVLSHTPLEIISRVNQRLRGSPRSQRQQTSPLLPARSVRFVLILMLTIFLVVPFLLYST